MNDENEKNILFNQVSALEEKSLRFKIYNYFYSIIKIKKDFNFSVLCILTIFETIQLISYAFSEPHLNSWKIKSSRMITISTVLGSLRISPLMKYVKYKNFIIIFFIVIILIFIFCIFILIQLLFRKSTSRFFERCTSFTQTIINPLVIFLYIPITEITLMQFKCSNGKIDVIFDADKCWSGIYYLYVILGAIFGILFFVCLLFHLLFYFSPFLYNNSFIKINSNNDVILFIFKFLFVLKFIWIKDEYLSIVISLILSLFLLANEIKDETYNNKILEKMLNVRNITVFWTYFVLLLSKFFEKTDLDGVIYILLFGYPIVIYLGIVLFQASELNFPSVIDDLTDVNRYIYQTKFFIKLINSFLIDNKNLKYGNEFENHTNKILIRGMIKTHIKSCIVDDCPLNKFLQNQGNYNVQKQCLLNFMNIHFNKGIKAFPFNCKIKIYCIQFNYSKKYNLNGVRTNLVALSKLRMDFKDEFITYCLKQEINKLENKSIDYSNENNDTEFDTDLVDQKYRRLKYLIENATKLYVEFWGIFASNITNNLNSKKIYILGEKLNMNLDEIKYLWDNSLKYKKIDLEHQGIVQLYSKFLREILWDTKKSISVVKKINDDNYYYREMKKKDDNNNNQKNNNIDLILENQDHLIFANSNEKGQCKIVQCSNSISLLFGYQKSEIIGKPIEILMPNIFIHGHMKMLEERIKKISTTQDSKCDLFNFSKKQLFILAQNKIGYLIPLNVMYNIYDDSDYSNSYVIKTKFEQKDTRSVYAYYILTKDDFTIVNISSSALNLGLSMDLLKKYVINLNLLIRGKNNEEINLFEKYTEYVNEPKLITWIFPDIIYPKDESKKIKDEDINYLIEKSNKKKYNLQINILRYDEEKIIGISFRFVEINNKRFTNMPTEKFLPIKKQEIMFDLLNLSYIRTIIVNQKTGLRNLRQNDYDEKNIFKKNLSISKEKEKNKKKISEMDIIQESSEDEEKKQMEFILTREKILELQTKDSAEVKQFINQLQFYGNDVSLEKQRPNKEKYIVGRITEPIIKIDLGNFIKRVDEQMGNLKNITKKKKPVNTIENERNINANNNYLYNNYLSSSINQNKEIKNVKEVNKETSIDINTSLAKLFKENSALYMSISGIFIFIFTFFITILEFSLESLNLTMLTNQLTYVHKSYKILNNMLYTKFFVTEGVLANELTSRINESYICLEDINIETFINNIRTELSVLRQEFTEDYSTLSSSSSSFSKTYRKFISGTNLTLKSISANNTITVKYQLSTAMSEIPTHIFYISTVTNTVINMSNRNVYDLMYNLLNDYFIIWEKATFILVDDFKYMSGKGNISKTLLASTFFISIFFTIVIWKILKEFGISRQKPIFLILTIKKKIFENLKNSAENFSNQLLNKFFGNDENEEESQQDYQPNIQMNDINIVKFKSPLSSISKENLYINIFIQMSSFFLIFEVYSILKYFSTKNVETNIGKFIDVYNATEYSHVYAIFSIDIIKSYFYDPTISILSKENKTKNKEPLFEVFYFASDPLEDNLILLYESNCFLKGYYKKQFIKYFYGDFSNLIPDKYKNDALIQNGFKSILIKFFETLKYISFIYFSNSKYYTNETTINLINDDNWLGLNEYTQYFIRYCFKGIIELIIKSFNDYVNKWRLIHTSLTIIFTVILLFYFIIVMGGHHEKVLSLLKKSRELVNLIPEEIKHIIVAKIDE